MAKGRRLGASNDTGTGDRLTAGSRVVVAAAIGGGLILVALAAAWVERDPIVAHYADRALANRHVLARYRIAAIGPFAQRLEAVSIGDPAAPDLTARALDLTVGYGLHGPYLAAVRADGVRLRGRLVGGRLSLGAIDRLLPASSSGPVTLPDLGVTLADAVATIDAPAGRLTARIEGAGNLADGFRGRVRATSARLGGAGCAAERIAADVTLSVTGRHPRIAGPVALGALDCRGLATGAGEAQVDLSFAPALDRWHGGATLAGFAGRAEATRFGALGGGITLAGTAKRTEGETHLTMAGLSGGDAAAGQARADGRYRYAPGTAGLVYSGLVTLDHARLAPPRRRAIADAAGGLVQTPLGPIAMRVATALDDWYLVHYTCIGMVR